MISRLTQPPRAVHPSVRLLMLFGGMNQAYWAFTALSLLMIVVALRGTDFSAVTFLTMEVRAAQATVTRVEASSSERYPGNTYYFEFSPAGGGDKRYQGQEFLGYQVQWQRGQRIPVEYLLRDPSRFRLAESPKSKGWASLSFIALSMLMALIFLALGLACLFMLWWGWREGRLFIALLQSGALTQGELLAKTRPADLNVGDLQFMFHTSTGEAYTLSQKVMKDQEHLLPEDQPLWILFNPADPEGAQLWSLLPGPPIVGPDGLPQPRLRYFGYLLLPLVALVGSYVILVYLH